jgi:hypothetical protein
MLTARLNTKDRTCVAGEEHLPCTTSQRCTWGARTHSLYACHGLRQHPRGVTADRSSTRSQHATQGRDAMYRLCLTRGKWPWSCTLPQLQTPCDFLFKRSEDLGDPLEAFKHDFKTSSAVKQYALNALWGRLLVVLMILVSTSIRMCYLPRMARRLVSRCQKGNGVPAISLPHPALRTSRVIRLVSSLVAKSGPPGFAVQSRNSGT